MSDELISPSVKVKDWGRAWPPVLGDKDCCINMISGAGGELIFRLWRLEGLLREVGLMVLVIEVGVLGCLLSWSLLISFVATSECVLLTCFPSSGGPSVSAKIISKSSNALAFLHILYAERFKCIQALDTALTVLH